MEKVEKDPGEARGPEHQEDKNGSSSQAAEAGVEVHQEIQEEQLSKQSQGEEIEESGERKWITILQAAADAKVSLQRTNREKEHRLRLELMERHEKATNDKFEEFISKWATDDPWLLEELKKQQALCTTIAESKNRVINELQQDLKHKDDRYARDLMKTAGELGLMMDGMEDTIKTLKQAYREELASLENVDDSQVYLPLKRNDKSSLIPLLECLKDIKRIHQQESDLLLTDETERDYRLNELLDRERARLTLRQRKVEESQQKVEDYLFQTVNHFNYQTEKNEKSKVQTTRLMKPIDLSPMKNRLGSLKKEFNNLKDQRSSNVKHFTERNRQLSDRDKRNIVASERHKRNIEASERKKRDIEASERHKRDIEASERKKRDIEASERIQKQIKHFAVADRKQYKEMSLMFEEEIKELAEKALHLDSVICKQHLGLAWERPPMPSMEQTGPIQPQKQAQSPAQRAASTSFNTMQASQGRQRMKDASVGPTLETYTDTGVHKEDAAGQSEGAVAVEEGKLSNEAVQKVTELLCDEAGFPLEEKPPSLLAPLEEEEKTVVKLGPLLKQHVSSRETSAHHLSQEAYWESMGNIISEDKLKVWEAAENKFKQYHARLTEVSELVTETQGLEQQNAELRRLLQQQHP